MGNYLVVFSSWILAFHIIAVMFWMAGMYYLPRLFVYHAQAMEDERDYAVFEVMEEKLLRIIMTPAMLMAWVFGLALVLRSGFLVGAGMWFWVKVFLVIGLSAYHGFLTIQRKRFLRGILPHSSRFFRMINEIPPVLTIVIVIMAVVQPF